MEKLIVICYIGFSKPSNFNKREGHWVKKKYQIFISSTYTDLVEAREKVRDAILSMMHFPIGMEMFSAADEEQWEIIRDTIDSSDYYVLILGHRYGSTVETGDDAGISYTEKEYRHAKTKKIPILAFILSDEVPVKRTDYENDPEKMEKLNAFKNDVKGGRIVEWWTNPDELASKVTVALYKQMDRKERPGWVRGDSLETDRKFDVSKASIKNRQIVEWWETPDEIAIRVKVGLREQVDRKERTNLIGCNSFDSHTEIIKSNTTVRSPKEKNGTIMQDKNYYLNLVVDLIIGDSYPDLPRGFQDPIIDKEMLQDFAVTLCGQYPNAVQQRFWTPMNLRKVIDSILDESDPIVKRLVFGDCFFSESDRQKILEQCTEIIRKRLQRCIGPHLKVCYKIMPNGRVGYRLE